MPDDLDTWARKSIAEYLRRGKAWNVIRDVVSGQGLTGDDIYRIQRRVEELAQEMANQLMYERKAM